MKATARHTHNTEYDEMVVDMCEKGTEKCDQIGRFLKVIFNIFFTKVAQIIVNFWANFNNDTFWANLS